MTEPCSKCGREYKSKRGREEHEKVCDSLNGAPYEEVREMWSVRSIVITMGDVHDPDIKPVVIVRGARRQRTKQKLYFRAILTNTKREVFCCNKATEVYRGEINTLLDNWVDFAREHGNDVHTMVQNERCYICGAHKVPGVRIAYRTLCVFCILQKIAGWIGGLK